MGFLKIRPVYSFTSSPSRFSLNSRALEISDSSPLHNRFSIISDLEVYKKLHDIKTETARESLELVFRMSNILDTGLDRHTLSVLIALCDLGLNPEALAAVVKELRQESGRSLR
ncbi:hypothetical protein HID58_072116 [Brassica napus]|uniref:Uncharacterized protein n=1 Tax=Brassica napus TaxID=3708 RepID=A0ABQ7Z3I4_BRANA|nr:hypothetical protein HID58_072116 [Brassica napus]